MAAVSSILVCCAALAAQDAGSRRLDQFHSPPCDEYLAHADMIMNAAHEASQSRVFVLVYEGKYGWFDSRKDRYVSRAPQRGLAKARIDSMKRYISAFRRASLPNLVFIDAGRRDELTVDVWLVPAGAEPPRPLPTTPKWKYALGRPAGFCLGCC